jgi:hypothetical protein
MGGETISKRSFRSGGYNVQGFGNLPVPADNVRAVSKMSMNLRCGFATLDIWCRMGSIKCMEAFGMLGCYRR